MKSWIDSSICKRKFKVWLYICFLFFFPQTAKKWPNFGKIGNRRVDYPVFFAYMGSLTGIVNPCSWHFMFWITAWVCAFPRSLFFAAALVESNLWSNECWNVIFTLTEMIKKSTTRGQHLPTTGVCTCLLEWQLPLGNGTLWDTKKVLPKRQGLASHYIPTQNTASENKELEPKGKKRKN